MDLTPLFMRLNFTGPRFNLGLLGLRPFSINFILDQLRASRCRR